MFILRTNDQSGLGIDDNLNDAAVAAQKAYLVDELLAPAAKLNPDGFRSDRLAALRMTRSGSTSPVRENLSRVSAIEKQTRSGFGSA